MKNYKLIFFSFFILLTACVKKDDTVWVCSLCTYQRPSNNSIMQARRCYPESDETLLTQWEENFKAQVRALGGEWDSLEITCVR